MYFHLFINFYYTTMFKLCLSYAFIVYLIFYSNNIYIMILMALILIEYIEYIGHAQ